MNDFHKLIGGTKPVLVDFFASWCGPCRMQGPVIDEVKAKVGDRADVVKIDIDRNQEVAARYNVRSVPTLILFVGGEPVWRAVGVQPADVLTAKLAEYC